jgi:CheY-like chemotaxis protein
VRVEVVDTGRGIPIEERSRIFTDFQSTETQTLNWHGSSGLGLSISKKFVELHQGCIGLESEVEQGSTFWFTLPKKNESHNCEKLRGVIREVPSELELSYKERILVAVCEDENTLTYLQRHLSGFKVLPATGIPEALHLLQEVRAMGILSTDPLPDIEIPDNVIYVQIPSSGIKEIARTFQVRDVLVKPVTRQGLLKGLLKLPEPASRILVADDDPDVARLYERMLVDYQGSREIIVAYNGIEALDAMRTYLPDLVLLDVAMPEMDGWEVLKQKALDLSIAHIPVIIISARFEEFLSARLAGVIGFTRRNGLQIGEVTTLVGDGLRSLAPEWFSVGDESGGGPESNDLG